MNLPLSLIRRGARGEVEKVITSKNPCLYNTRRELSAIG
jgi:hypothetical protein